MMTGDIATIPNFEGAITGLILAISQFVVLAGLLTGVVNTIKGAFGFLGRLFFIVPVALGVGLMISIVALFGDVFALSIGQGIFFGVFIGFASIGLYEAGLGKKKEVVKEEPIGDLDESDIGVPNQGEQGEI